MLRAAYFKASLVSLAVPARARHRVPGPEAGQPSPGHGGLREDRGLRAVQGRHEMGRPHQDLLWHAGVFGARGV